jgi:diaminohydroxyphosphoribosylaminopyrimidine deaminase/5-amino-6-(5-phosphoribosylamino)uracil reductase
MASDIEAGAMKRAVEISDGALGTTNPNPCVGAVILDPAGGLVAEGVTQPVGGAHAEIEALRAAGARASGATLIVTLEPCNHVGRTGACTEAIIAAGIARVVYAVADPHPRAAGGADRLRAAGIDVEAGLLAADADEVLEPWRVAAKLGRPHVTWKYAASLDGRTAAADGSSRWITGEAARASVHGLRSTVDAVIVGVGTVLADDPVLTARVDGVTRQPLRVVVDTAARTPVTARVLDDAAPTLIAVGTDADAERVAALTETGADVARVGCREGRVDVRALLDVLAAREVGIALLEGGATLAASFVRAGLVDRVIGYLAPVLLGDGVPMLAGFGVDTLTAAPRLAISCLSWAGGDLRIEARFRDTAQTNADPADAAAATEGGR